MKVTVSIKGEETERFFGLAALECMAWRLNEIPWLIQGVSRL
jgi:hypothetical protein